MGTSMDEVNPVSNADVSLSTVTSAATRYRPEITFELVSLRELHEKLSAADREKLTQFLESDPYLNNITAEVLPPDPDPVGEQAKRDSGFYISADAAELVAQKLTPHFSPEARAYISTLVDFYFGYLRPFPDITEVEPLKSLVAYLNELPNWDVLMAKSEFGRIIGACSGQIVEVPFDGGSFKIAWNEHTWADKEYRRFHIGSTLAKTFTENARQEGAIGVVIETDNPYLITTDPEAFNHADPAAREKYWKDVLNQAMDPFQRFQFWGGQGFGLLAAGTPPVPVAYEQISMDLGVIGSCKTINLAFQPISPEYGASLPKDTYIALLIALQKTINEDATFYPELVRTIEQVKEIPEELFTFINLKKTEMLESMKLGVASKTGSTDADIEYCNKRLAQEIGEREREILTRSKEFLMTQTV